MYTEICAELGEAIAAVSRAPYIQFHLIFRSVLLRVGLPETFIHDGSMGANILLPTRVSYSCPASGTGVRTEDYSLDGLLRRELTFTSMPKENVLRTLYILRLYPALKSSERVRL